MQANLSLIKEVPSFSGAHASIANAEAKKLRAKAHQTVQKITNDLDHDFRFNTAVSSIMELVNEIYTFQTELHDETSRQILRESLEIVVRLLSPFAPHLCEELWSQMGHEEILATTPWRDHDPDAVQLDVIPIVVQVNGKLRANLMVAKDVAGVQDALVQMALKDSKVAAHIGDKPIVKTIVVPGRLVNFVVKG